MSEQLKDLQALFRDAMEWGRAYLNRAMEVTIEEVSLGLAEKAAALTTAARTAEPDYERKKAHEAPLVGEQVPPSISSAPTNSSPGRHVHIVPESTPSAARKAAPVTREFTNELGNAIRITIEGPTSVSENILTPMEANELRAGLNDHAARAAEPEPWVPYLLDRADGVRGHYCIARMTDKGIRETWSPKKESWGAFSDTVFVLGKTPPTGTSKEGGEKP